MKCIVVNLKRAHGRNERITEQFENLGIEFEFFAGIDGHELPEEDYTGYGDEQSGLVQLEASECAGYASMLDQPQAGMAGCSR